MLGLKKNKNINKDFRLPPQREAILCDCGYPTEVLKLIKNIYKHHFKILLVYTITEISS